MLVKTKEMKETVELTKERFEELVMQEQRKKYLEKMVDYQAVEIDKLKKIMKSEKR